jgi:hypothetical protein
MRSVSREQAEAEERAARAQILAELDAALAGAANSP